MEFVNLAIGDIPLDRVRFHTCYSIDIGPRIHDMPLKDIVDIMLKVNAGAYSFEATTRVTSTSTTSGERRCGCRRARRLSPASSPTPRSGGAPELIAERIVRFARARGRERDRRRRLWFLGAGAARAGHPPSVV